MKNDSNLLYFLMIAIALGAFAAGIYIGQNDTKNKEKKCQDETQMRKLQ